MDVLIDRNNIGFPLETRGLLVFMLTDWRQYQEILNQLIYETKQSVFQWL